MIDVHIVRVEDDGAVVLDPRPGGPGRYRLRDLGPVAAAVEVVVGDGPAVDGAPVPSHDGGRGGAGPVPPSGGQPAVSPRGGAARRPRPSRAVPPPQGGRGPRLTPAQVQARLRAGAEPEDVARDAGVDLDWVARWAGPVEAEKSEMIRSALGAVVIDPDGGTTEETLGALVRAWLPRGVDREDLDWLVARRRDGRWRLTLRAPSPRGMLTATWIWAPRTRALVPASARARTITWPER